MDRHHRTRIAKNGEVPDEYGYKWIGTTGQGWLKMGRSPDDYGYKWIGTTGQGWLKMERCLVSKATNG